MNKFLLSFFLLYSTVSIAQDINEIKFTVDSVRFDNITAPVRRSNEGELNKYIASGGKNFTIAQPLKVLEDGLTNAKAIVTDGRKKIQWLPNMKEQLTKIKKTVPKFRLVEYEQELKLYEHYNARFESVEKNRQSNIDSVRKATELAKMRENDRKIAAEVNKNKVKQKNADSIRKSYDSLMVIAARNEAKAHREYCIKKFGTEYGPLVADGLVKPGMTQEMCLTALGEPVSKTKPDNGVETWNYLAYTLKFNAGKLERVDKK